MRRTISKIIALVLILVSTISMTDTTYAQATTLSELFEVRDEEINTNQEILKLLNLATLRKIDIDNITYKDKTITDVLNRDELDLYAVRESTTQVYIDAIEQASTGLQNGWSVQNVIKFADKAYEAYGKYLDTLELDVISDVTITEAIRNYIATYIDKNIDVGDVKSTLPLILADYALMSVVVIENPNKIDVSTNFGITETDNTKYECTKTTWYTNGQPMKALFNGTIEEITPTSVTTFLGSTDHGLKVIYISESPIVLLGEDIKVGDYVAQNTEFIQDNLATIQVELRYNNKNIDLMSLLGVTGKLLINEYAI